MLGILDQLAADQAHWTNTQWILRADFQLHIRGVLLVH